MEDTRTVPTYVIGPDGERMTKADLPPPETRRWVPRRKAKVVAAVEGGLISREEAQRLYSITDEEFEIWRNLLSSQGMRGLRVTRIGRSRGRSE